MITEEIAYQFGIALGMEAVEAEAQHRVKLDYRMDCVYVEESEHYDYLMREFARIENHPKDHDGTVLEESPLYKSMRKGLYDGVKRAIDAHRERGTYPTHLLPEPQ